MDGQTGVLTHRRLRRSLLLPSRGRKRAVLPGLRSPNSSEKGRATRPHQRSGAEAMRASPPGWSSGLEGAWPPRTASPPISSGLRGRRLRPTAKPQGELRSRRRGPSGLEPWGTVLVGSEQSIEDQHPGRCAQTGRHILTSDAAERNSSGAQAGRPLPSSPRARRPGEAPPPSPPPSWAAWLHYPSSCHLTPRLARVSFLPPGGPSVCSTPPNPSHGSWLSLLQTGCDECPPMSMPSPGALLSREWTC